MLSRRRLGSTVTLLLITVVAIALILGQLPKNSLQESAIDSNKEKQEREKTIPETRSETSNPLLSSGNTNETEQKSEENSPVLTPSASTEPAPPTPSPNIPVENGLCYSPFRDGQDPNLGLYPTVEQINEDMQFLKNITGCIRTYGATSTLANIPALAKQTGLRVFQGITLTNESEANEIEISRVANLASQGLVDSIIVGNEVLLSGALTEAQLINYIHEVREQVPKSMNISITTADDWSEWIKHPSLVKEVDYILAHIHPFWWDQPIENATKYVVESYQSLNKTNLNLGKPIVIGETGWPSAGDSNWTGVPSWVVPSGSNQRKFLEEFIKWASENQIKYFLFETFDEEWKWKERRSGTDLGELVEPSDKTFSGSFVGSSWGIFQSNGTIKNHLKGLFNETLQFSSRQIREVYVGERLLAGYDFGVNSSGNRTDWLSDMNGSMRMDYPAGQSWGAVFITIGKSTNQLRPWKDFSRFQTVAIELKAKQGGESIDIGIKDTNDADDGREAKIKTPHLSTEWQTYNFTLSSFHTANLEELYVVVEFVFEGPAEQTVFFRNIKYLP